MIWQMALLCWQSGGSQISTSPPASTERNLGDVSIDRRWIELLCRSCLHTEYKPPKEIPGWPELTLEELRSRASCRMCSSNVVRIEEIVLCPEMFEGIQHAIAE